MFPFPLYLITDPLLCAVPAIVGGGVGNHLNQARLKRSLFETVEEAIEGGARLLQYREKTGVRREMYETAKRLREITAGRGVTFIINDQVDLALAVQADGVHLGQEDLPLWAARKVLGGEAIIGVSTHCVDQAIRAKLEGADYIGLGPIFKSRTKDSLNLPVGIQAITQVKREVRIPLYAIGGIRLLDLPDVMKAGADGVAVVSAVAGDIRSNLAEWIVALKKLGKLDKMD